MLAVHAAQYRADQEAEVPQRVGRREAGADEHRRRLLEHRNAVHAVGADGRDHAEGRLAQRLLAQRTSELGHPPSPVVEHRARGRFGVQQADADQAEEFVATRDVVVERRHRHAQPLGHRRHGDCLDALLVRDLQGHARRFVARSINGGRPGPRRSAAARSGRAGRGGRAVRHLLPLKASICAQEGNASGIAFRVEAIRCRIDGVTFIRRVKSSTNRSGSRRLRK